MDSESPLGRFMLLHRATCHVTQDELIALSANVFASMQLYGSVIVVPYFYEFWRKEEIPRETDEECF